MKKLLALLLALITIFAFSSCNEKSKSEEDDKNNNEQTSDIVDKELSHAKQVEMNETVDTENFSFTFTEVTENQSEDGKTMSYTVVMKTHNKTDRNRMVTESNLYCYADGVLYEDPLVVIGLLADSIVNVRATFNIPSDAKSVKVYAQDGNEPDAFFIIK